MKKTKPAAVPCPQCGESLPPGTDWCPRCLGESFFETDSITMPLAETDLKQVGRYRVVELLGEGGFGRVYRALETGPLAREVALKVIKPGLDSRPIIARFNAERQMLVLLDHPNIARVLDAGETDDGRPFFVMELVEGLPLSEFIRTESPPLEARLRIFLQICAAVEHAHAKGVIHRDLKPGNILVTWPDGAQGGAKATVIDFGIAKALFSETALHTGTLGARLVLGTPEYMSPEQATTGDAGVDTRSDVFSLGALLFEMLTGTPPLSSEQFRRASLEEVLRIIREQEPVRPSARMTEMAAHDATARRLAGRTQNELDWVVLKALAKERERRYQTARELGEDVRRFMDNDTVLARPPSFAYQAGKFVRRHRAPMAAVLVAAVSLVTVAVVSLLSAGRERQAQAVTRRHFSDSDAAQAHDRAQANRYAEAVALLCRALRTDPENEAARMRLLTLLAEAPCGVTAAPPLTESMLVDSVRFLPPDGSRILTRTIRHFSIWESGQSEPRLLHRLERNSGICVESVSTDGRWLALGNSDGGCRVWDTFSGQVAHNLLRVTDGAMVRVCAFSTDGSRLFIGGHDGSVCCFDRATGLLAWQHTHPAPITALAVSTEGTRLLAGTGGRLVPAVQHARWPDAQSHP